MPPLHFPGPKHEACTPCFQVSKDDVGISHLSLGVDNGAISASKWLQNRTAYDDALVPLIYLVAAFFHRWPPVSLKFAFS